MGTIPAYLLAIVLEFLPFRAVSGLATIYWPGDRNCGLEKADGTPFRRSDSHIAHRRLPLGTVGVLCNVPSGRCTVTIVGDRGPYGAIRLCGAKPDGGRRIRWFDRCYHWQAQPRRLRRGWAYRGEFDLTRPVAKAIGHKAFDPVIFFYLSSTRRPAPDA